MIRNHPTFKIIAMLKNYILIALRNLWKSKGTTSINILGLSLGLACFSLILLYVVNELNYDRLGATVGSIVALLSKDFLRLVLVAAAIAIPFAWWAMSKWLADFAYRIEIQWWMFALAGIAAIGIALLTVSFQAVRAAVANPVESLRSE